MRLQQTGGHLQPSWNDASDATRIVTRSEQSSQTLGIELRLIWEENRPGVQQSCP
jgi:hypothetical protein